MDYIGKLTCMAYPDDSECLRYCCKSFIVEGCLVYLVKQLHLLYYY